VSEQKQLDDSIRLLASSLKQDGETDEQAFERVKNSRFVTTYYVHNEDAAFYRVDFKLGKVILTINTAHPFHEKLYQPLAALSKKASAIRSGEPDGDDTEVDVAFLEECSEVLVNLRLLLLSLGRTQSEMCAVDTTGERDRLPAHDVDGALRFRRL
jgi:hypothetical protein